MDFPLEVIPTPAALRDSGCTRCDLHEGVNSVCVPTVRHGPCGPAFPISRLDTEHQRAVIIVGEAPGKTEDLQGKPFVGKAGRMLREAYIDFFDLPSKVDVYLSNAVRCRPPQNKEPTKTQIKTCQGFLLTDIRTLQGLYDEVIVLAVGGPAVMSTTGGSLKKWLSCQGETTDFTQVLKNSKKAKAVIFDVLGPLYPQPCRVFATYHPSYLLRNPSAGMAVHAHMRLLRDFLDGNLKIELDADLEIAVAPLPPEYFR